MIPTTWKLFIYLCMYVFIYLFPLVGLFVGVTPQEEGGVRGTYLGNPHLLGHYPDGAFTLDVKSV
jgi:hypothetical protein